MYSPGRKAKAVYNPSTGLYETASGRHYSPQSYQHLQAVGRRNAAMEHRSPSGAFSGFSAYGRRSGDYGYQAYGDRYLTHAHHYRDQLRALSPRHHRGYRTYGVHHTGTVYDPVSGMYIGAHGHHFSPAGYEHLRALGRERARDVHGHFM